MVRSYSQVSSAESRWLNSSISPSPMSGPGMASPSTVTAKAGTARHPPRLANQASSC